MITGAALSSVGGAETGQDGTGLTASGAENGEDEPGPGDRPAKLYRGNGISWTIHAIRSMPRCTERMETAAKDKRREPRPSGNFSDNATLELFMIDRHREPGH